MLPHVRTRGSASLRFKPAGSGNAAAAYPVENMVIMARKRLLQGVMKHQPSPTRRFAVIHPFGWVRLGWLLVTFWLFTPQLIFGTDKQWTGAINSTWSTGANWVGGAPPGGTTDN